MDRRDVGIGVAASAWFGTIGAGFVLLWSYAAKPGEAEAVAPSWPIESELERSTDSPTLVMIAHTDCPCTLASLSELGEIVGRTKDELSVIVVVEAPSGSDEDPLESRVAEMAQGLPGVLVVVDHDHREAELFGARTSGHSVLFDATGALLFAGGITGARGHAGENEGRASILALIHGRAGSSATPTFGCPTNEEP